MVERALGDVELIQDILNGHVLVARNENQPLGHIQNLVTLDSIFFFFDNPRHHCPFYKPTVGLFIETVYAESWQGSIPKGLEPRANASKFASEPSLQGL
jgi:hypothetical protein